MQKVVVEFCRNAFGDVQADGLILTSNSNETCFSEPALKSTFKVCIFACVIIGSENRTKVYSMCITNDRSNFFLLKKTCINRAGAIA